VPRLFCLLSRRQASFRSKVKQAMGAAIREVSPRASGVAAGTAGEVKELAAKLESIEQLIVQLAAAQSKQQELQTSSAASAAASPFKPADPAGGGGDAAAAPATAAAAAALSYHDVGDPRPAAELERPEEQPLEALGADEKRNFELSERLVKSMGMGGSIKLSVARALPPNDVGGAGNAFRDSCVPRASRVARVWVLMVPSSFV